MRHRIIVTTKNSRMGEVTDQVVVELGSSNYTPVRDFIARLVSEHPVFVPGFMPSVTTITVEELK